MGGLTSSSVSGTQYLTTSVTVTFLHCHTAFPSPLPAYPKIASKVTTTGDKDELQNNLDNELQNDLDSLVSWAQKWQMNFNVGKCKVLHIGSNNDRVNYSMNGVQLSKVHQEKDLGCYNFERLKTEPTM